jgi:ABC-type multidrug transport system fused ATPase/permease subunit
MSKLKKIGVWTFGLVLALALVVNQLVQMLAGYLLQLGLITDYIQSLSISGNSLMLNILSWALIIITAFVTGIVLVAIYNLVSRWIGIKIELTEKKR